MISVVLPSLGGKTEARPKSRVTFGVSGPQGQKLSTRAETGHAGAKVRWGSGIEGEGPPPGEI